VNPLNLIFGLAEAGKRYGGHIYTNTEVHTIRIRNGQVVAVRTNKGEILTTTVVNAAGIHASNIGKKIGIKLPLSPVRGQTVVTESTAPLLEHKISSVSYLRGKLENAFEGKTMVLRDEDSTFFSALAGLEQTVNGNLLMGTTIETKCNNKSTTLKGIKAVARNAVRIVPALKNLKLIRSFAGVRPKTLDGLPILGEVDDVEGFYLACGHGGDGVALAPITGKLLADLIVNGTPSMFIHKLNLSRFN
jgi:sarcosine oxidase subunit beta